MQRRRRGVDEPRLQPHGGRALNDRIALLGRGRGRHQFADRNDGRGLRVHAQKVFARQWGRQPIGAVCVRPMSNTMTFVSTSAAKMRNAI